MSVSPFFSAAELAGKPPPPLRWLWDGIVPAATLTILSGDGAAGKTMVMLQLATAVVTGARLFGLDTLSGPAIFASSEDDRDELHRRLAAIAAATGTGLERLRNLHLAALADGDAALARQDGHQLRWTATFDAMTEMIAKVRPALVVIDPASEAFAGNENDRAAVAAFAGGLRRLAQRSGAAVVLIAHPSVSGLADGTGRGGSTGWNNAARQRLYLEADARDASRRRLTVKKSNLAASGAVIELRFVGGIYARDDGPSPADRAASARDAEAVFLSVLTRFHRERRPLSPSPSNTYAPAVIAADAEAASFGKKELAAAMSSLLRKGAIRVVVEGPPSKPRRHLVPANSDASSNELLTPSNAPPAPSNALCVPPPYTPRAVGRVGSVGTLAPSPAGARAGIKPAAAPTTGAA
jgi:RecA-family ATPase